ncbi:hypothetical protein MKW98_025466 [Papaver atlanticum]|uniref:Uncharacterized protein n=1 Tax=Papaver atlanticum TaxID=357466 RepID=A0AAD4SE94_9MAGN|nr:hypothetical protein MKW98_025466 [Papaver atlanticum]
MSRGGGVGITNAVNVGIAVQADWENREFISNTSINVRRLFDFLINFDKICQYRFRASRKLHPGGSESIFDIDRRVGEKTQVIAQLPEDRLLCGFGLIFAGGYAAGYYSYKDQLKLETARWKIKGEEYLMSLQTLFLQIYA